MRCTDKSPGAFVACSKFLESKTLVYFIPFVPFYIAMQPGINCDVSQRNLYFLQTKIHFKHWRLKLKFEVTNSRTGTVFADYRVQLSNYNL